MISIATSMQEIQDLLKKSNWKISRLETDGNETKVSLKNTLTNDFVHCIDINADGPFNVLVRAMKLVLK